MMENLYDDCEADRLHILTDAQNEFIDLRMDTKYLYAFYHPDPVVRPILLGIVGQAGDRSAAQWQRQADVAATLDTIRSRMAKYFPDVRFILTPDNQEAQAVGYQSAL